MPLGFISNSEAGQGAPGIVQCRARMSGSYPVVLKIARWAVRQLPPGRSTIERTDDAMTSTVENMGIDHCCTDVFVPKQFLNGADVIAGLQKMSCK